MDVEDNRLQTIKDKMDVYSDWPKKGVDFVDFFSLTEEPETRNLLFDLLDEYLRKADLDFDTFVGLETRGFILGFELAQRMQKRFVPVRKAGKLPGECIGTGYETEYSNDKIEMQRKALNSQSRVIIVDDLLATGGTLAASEELIGKMDATVVGYLVVFEIAAIKGRDKLLKPSSTLSLIKI